MMKDVINILNQHTLIAAKFGSGLMQLLAVTALLITT